MKKLFTLLLALVMIACLGIAAFAEAEEPALDAAKPAVKLSSNTATVTAGSSTTGLTVEAKHFDGKVTWSVNADPKNDKISGSVSGTALTITTDATLTAGTYTIKVKADNGKPAAGKQEATATLTLTVNEAHVCGDGVKQDGQAATCMAAGWKDYYKCSCNKLYEEATCKTEITALEAWKTGKGAIKQLKHEDILQKTNKVEATCAADGCKEYFYCESCTKYFADKNGNNPIGDDTALAAWKAKEGHEGGLIKQLEHKEKDLKDMTRYEQLNPTCANAGHLEYYYCDVCKNYYCKNQPEPKPEPKELLTLDSKPEDKLVKIGDAELLKVWLAEGGDGYLAPLGHDDLELALVEDLVAPTCTVKGHLAYYYCESCELYYCLTADLQKDEVQEEVQLNEAEETHKYTQIGGDADLEDWLAESGAGYIAPLGHDMGEWEDSKDGKTHTRACQREGCEYTETEEHVYKNGVCEACGAKEKKPAPAPKKPPKTGDESNVALWAVMALTLGGGATAVVLKKKHN